MPFVGLAFVLNAFCGLNNECVWQGLVQVQMVFCGAPGLIIEVRDRSNFRTDWGFGSFAGGGGGWLTVACNVMFNQPDGHFLEHQNCCGRFVCASPSLVASCCCFLVSPLLTYHSLKKIACTHVSGSACFTCRSCEALAQARACIIHALAATCVAAVVDDALPVVLATVGLHKCCKRAYKDVAPSTCNPHSQCAAQPPPSTKGVGETH